jgi:hypothetical protein
MRVKFTIPPKFPIPRGRRTRTLLASGVALAGLSGLAFSQVTPAVADPTVTLAAVGVDATQDVYNQFALDLTGSNLLGSWNATGASPISYTDGTSGAMCSFQRPGGSAAGVVALQDAIKSPPPPPGPLIPQPGCVDIARSAEGVTKPSATGAIVWIPFAIDAVAAATGPASCTGTACSAYPYTYTEASGSVQNTVSAAPVPTNITHANLFTEVDLYNLYFNCATVTAGGVTYWPSGSPTAQPAGSQQIDLYLPPAGSGTASFWASTFGSFSVSAPPPCVHQVIVGGALATAAGGVPVVDSDGTAMATDPDGFGPFPVAQWAAQSNGHFDRRHTAVVQPLEACSVPLGVASTCAGPALAPYTTAGGTAVNVNPNFPLTFPVYSVVPYARVINAGDPLYSFLNANSIQDTLCNDFSAISSYGFAPIAQCGQVLTANRGGPAAGPTSVSVAVSASPNPATPGTLVVLSAVVTPATATGTIQFAVNGTAVGGPDLISGGTTSNVFTAPSVTAPTVFTITATYIPTGNFAATTPGTTSLTVT